MPSKISSADAGDDISAFTSMVLSHPKPNTKATTPPAAICLLPSEMIKLILYYFNHTLLFSRISARNTINVNTVEGNVWIYFATKLWFASLPQASATLEQPIFDTKKYLRKQFTAHMAVAKAAGLFNEIFIAVM